MFRRYWMVLPAVLLAGVPSFIAGQSAPSSVPAQTQRQTNTPSSLPVGTPSPMHSASESSAGHFYAKSPLSIDEEEIFLQRANIVSRKGLDTGVTKTSRLTLSDGRVTHDAHWQTIDIYKPVFNGANGTVEKDFRDSYKFNIAAYRIAKLLGLQDMVPVSMPRVIDDIPGAITWWADNIEMSEKERRDRKVPVPTDQTWINQLNTVRVFDQLIYNIDRTQENLLITKDWKVIMIDHTRSFRDKPTLYRPDALTRCDVKLLQRLKALKVSDVRRECSAFLTPSEIQFMMIRRDVITRFFDTERKQKGDDAVLTGLPRSTPQVTLP